MTDDEVIADLIAKAQPRTEKVEVCARGDLVDRHLALTIELGEAINAEPKSMADQISPRVAEIHEQIGQVEAEQAEAATTFTMRSIGALAWANLVRDHPPRAGVDNRLSFNLETFPPAAVAACALSPVLTLEQATTLYTEVLHSAEWDKLWEAAFTLNETATPRPKLPAAIERLLRNGRSLTTADPVGSLADPSSVESGEAPPSTTTTTPVG